MAEGAGRGCAVSEDWAGVPARRRARLLLGVVTVSSAWPAAPAGPRRAGPRRGRAPPRRRGVLWHSLLHRKLRGVKRRARLARPHRDAAMDAAVDAAPRGRGPHGAARPHTPQRPPDVARPWPGRLIQLASYRASSSVRGPRETEKPVVVNKECDALLAAADRPYCKTCSRPTRACLHSPRQRRCVSLILLRGRYAFVGRPNA